MIYASALENFYDRFQTRQHSALATGIVKLAANQGITERQAHEQVLRIDGMLMGHNVDVQDVAFDCRFSDAWERIEKTLNLKRKIDKANAAFASLEVQVALSPADWVPYPEVSLPRA